jgi:hypothetical protein
MINTFTTTGGTAHSRIVTGLVNGNSYTYYVRCIDATGNNNTNDFPISFSVGGSGLPPLPPPPPSLGDDIISPIVTITAPTQNQEFPLGTTSATLSATTNEAANCRYSTTANVAYSLMTNTFTTTGGTTHSRTLTGLVNGNSYTYYVRCIDAVGNANTNDFTISFSVASSGGTNETTPQTIIASLVQTIDTSQFSPPSPDSAGIAYLTSSNTLLMSDSEVDEMTIWSGANLFEMTLQGSLLRTSDTISFSKEPTGVAYNPVNGHVFISDDNKRRIFEINTGADSLVGTGDDIITSFNTTSFGCDDPEGVAFGQGSVFIACGVATEVFRVSSGFNGVFDGVSPAGDDQVSHFDTSVLGLSDPEGIEFNPDRNTLYILSRNRAMRETTLDGNLVSVIDISAANSVSPAGLAYGPGSLDPTKKSIYITARGIDNGINPTENDGKIYEMSLS